MNILYITYVDFKNNNFAGVKKKVIGQLNSMEELGNEVIYTALENNKFYSYKKNKKSLICNFDKRYKLRLVKYHKNLIKLIEEENINSVYIRHSNIDFLLINFIKKMHKKNINIYLDIPTFPYDREMSKVRSLIDLFNRQFLNKYISKIIISSCNKKKIFGVDTIFIDNCVDSRKIKFLNRNFKDNDINIIAVSYIRKTNGYDRFIEGLSKYYKNDGQRIINVNFIGNGEEVEPLINLTKKYGLEHRIKFVGSKTGNELDSYFERADLAIGSLADHRDNIFTKAPLKSREYCARGIPFISAVEDPGFSGNEKFILRFPANDEPIDINKVVHYYDNLKGKDISNKMRKYALENFNWVKQYRKIKDFNNLELKNYVK